MERNIATTPIAIPRTRRRDEWRGLTSCRAGSIVPVAFFPLLREDAIRGSITLQIRMAEALHTIINPVRVTAQATLIPKSALARFEGSMETLNRSYSGQPLPGGGNQPSWFLADPTVTGAALDDDKGHAFYDALGVHYKSDTYINSDLIESYFQMVNWRRASVSKALLPLDVSPDLAPAFWNSWKFDMIKPSFDAAMMEGVVPITVNAQNRVIQVSDNPSSPGTTPGVEVSPANLNIRKDSAGNAFVVDADGSRGWLSLIQSELGGSISLANIAMATKSMQFAKMRERYQGLPDEYLIELLMQGIRVPPEDFREPILLGMRSAVIGQSEQYATDGASLDVSVTRGIASMSVPFATPAVNPGGIVLVTIEIVPEQLYERVQDGFLSADSRTAVPDALADFLDPQKVEAVPNKYADVFHGQPDDVFGYAPLNYQWQRSFARVGGRYKRLVNDGFLEDRQRIWAVEKANPTLSDDFYVCPQPFPHTVFADADADPFEVISIGQAVITGLTQFGVGFEEDDDHYEKVIAQIDTGRIESEPVGAKMGDTVAAPPLPETAKGGEE